MSFLDLKKSVLAVKTRVGRESPGHNQEGVCEAKDTELSLTGHALLSVLFEVFAASHFECTSTWNDALVVDGVADCAEAVTDCFFNLRNRVVIGSLN